MRKFASVVGLFAVLAASGTAPAATPKGDAIRESVVKIYSTSRAPDVVRPWQKHTPQEASGTGIVIEGKRILTNAHVVNYASQVFVEPNESGEKLAATVEHLAPGIDLAVLKLEDESFFDKRPPLPRAEKLPEIKESVTVYGYPTGGASLSITKGIVSRIEFVGYGNHTLGLRIQIDAAVNPGNSGGPALVDDKMIGVTFSGIRGADNIGYIIPSEEVDLFLKDVADGTYDGKPRMREQLQTLENEALRAKLGFQKKAIGMVDHEIDNVGMTRVRDNLRLKFEYYIQTAAKDGKLPLTIVRDGKEMAIELPVSNQVDDLLPSLRGHYPSYLIYGPLVFSPATIEFLSTREGMQAAFALPGSPLGSRRADRVAFPGEQLVVVAAPMFPHKIGKGYGNPAGHVVKEVNGARIKNFRHLVETLRDAKDKYITITFDDLAFETLVFDRAEVLAATDEILSDNSVRQPCSEDIAPIWSKK
jgi:S1-C subfamily serine protease